MTTSLSRPTVGEWVRVRLQRREVLAIVTATPLSPRGACSVLPCGDPSATSIEVARDQIGAVEHEPAGPHPTMHPECLPAPVRDKYLLRSSRGLSVPVHAAHASLIVHHALAAEGYGKALGGPLPLQHDRYATSLPPEALAALHNELPHTSDDRRSRRRLTDMIWRAMGLLDFTGEDYWLIEQTTWRCSNGDCEHARHSAPHSHRGGANRCWW
ncbi:hypothetical protein [Gordonia malaquae]|uniref:hypothetical protein n=1 Tax=Gordonia malaquae TaxID=410332 RepID=UPI003016F8A6